MSSLNRDVECATRRIHSNLSQVPTVYMLNNIRDNFSSTILLLRFQIVSNEKKNRNSFSSPAQFKRTCIILYKI